MNNIKINIQPPWPLNKSLTGTLTFTLSLILSPIATLIYALTGDNTLVTFILLAYTVYAATKVTFQNT